MIPTPGILQMLITLWILAGLLVAGVNGVVGVSLMDAPLSGYSESARRVNQGLHHYHILRNATRENISSAMALLNARYAPPAASPQIAEQSQTTTPAPAKRRAAPPVPVDLPVLSGILTRRNTGQAVSHQAVLDGRLCTPGEIVGGLTVKTISPRGVMLTKGARHWFIDAPQHRHSLTTR